jgi:hypothetical protein
MRPRILNYRVTATHETITPLAGLNDAVAISDFHAFVFDPNGLHADSMGIEVLQRRRSELQDLLRKKGGIIICLLRPNTFKLNIAGFGVIDTYSLLDARNQIINADQQVSRLVAENVRSGTGRSITSIRSARGPTSAYFQVLRENLQFEACLELSEAVISRRAGTIFATNSVGYPIAVEFRAGDGVITFVPVPQDVPGDRTAAAIVRVVALHYDKQTDIDVPSWAQAVVIPGAQAHDGRIAGLLAQRERLTAEISELERARDGIVSYRSLLFGYGKGVLEPQVRKGLRLFGFNVREPDEYAGEWDVDLTDNQSGVTALGEVEGSEGPIDIDKSRQLLDYIEAEAVEGRDHKGILIGNGFRLAPLDSPERQQQFSDHARRAATRFQFCLLPTTELFKAVCALLESPQDEALKTRIRESLLRAVGPWSFAREQSPQVEGPQN